MNRRQFLASLAGGGITTLAGCSTFQPGNNPDTADADGDGVVDAQDYAPWDSEVQNKTDVLDATVTTPVTPADAPDADPISRILSASRVNAGQPVYTGPNDSVLFSSITDYSQETLTIDITDDILPATPVTVLVVLRAFPRGDVYAHTISETISDPTTIELSAPAPDTDGSLPEDTPLYYAAYILPPDPNLTGLTTADVTYIHETDPFVATSDASLSPYTDIQTVGDLQTDTVSRSRVEGGYIIQVTGRTEGKNWTITYFVSQSAYIARATEPRGRTLVEYSTLAVGSPLGEDLAALIRQATLRAGLSEPHLQAAVAIDFIQAFPYIEDKVSAGYDEYPKFIEETLVELRGDCEDSAILLGVILEALGFNVVFVTLPAHVGLGVSGEYEGSYVTYEQTQYFYIETTGEGWAVGDLPEVLDTSEVTVEPI